jgi:hypothetical protein
VVGVLENNVHETCSLRSFFFFVGAFAAATKSTLSVAV